MASIPRDLQAERILVDNASTDDSWKLAEKYGFRVVHADNEHKFITGINAALTAATGNYILFSQADVVFGKESIRYLQYAAEFEQNSIIQPVFLKDGKIDNAGMLWRWPGFGFGELRIKKMNAYPTDVCTDITFITTKDIMKRVGLYDINFSPAYYEDCSWALDSRDFGIRHLVLGKAIVHHRHNESFSAFYKKKEISDICRRNRRYLIKKHYRGIDKWTRLAVTACLDVAKKAIDKIGDWRHSPDYRH